MKTETKTDESITQRHKRLRHIVEKNKDGTPKDRALCGYIWDIYPIEPDGSICEKCKMIMERQGWDN